MARRQTQRTRRKALAFVCEILCVLCVESLLQSVAATAQTELNINSIQLMNDGKRWWIVTIFRQGEDEKNPIRRCICEAETNRAAIARAAYSIRRVAQQRSRPESRARPLPAKPRQCPELSAHALSSIVRRQRLLRAVYRGRYSCDVCCRSCRCSPALRRSP